MLLKHGLNYFSWRFVAAAINLLTIVLYTRLLSPAEYGYYALTLGVINLLSYGLYEFLQQYLIRFYQEHMSEPDKSYFLANVQSVFVIISLVGVLIVALIYFFATQFIPNHYLAFAMVLFILQAAFNLGANRLRAEMAATAYGMQNLLKAMLGCFTGILCAYFYPSAMSVLLGFGVGLLVPVFYMWVKEWRNITFIIDKSVLQAILRYGLPLTVALCFNFVINYTDRYLLAYFNGAAEAGIYSACYDLTNQALTLVLVIVNLATFPLAINALAQNNIVLAQKRLAQNIVLLLVIGLPVLVLFIFLNTNISHVLLGKNFSAGAAQIMPIMALAYFFAGIKSYHFDLSFQLRKATVTQIWICLSVLIINIFISIVFIKWLGLRGAAIATMISYLIAMLLSAWFGRRYLVGKPSLIDIVKLLLAAVVMALVIVSLATGQGLIWLLVQAALSGVIYLVLLYFLRINALLDVIKNS